MISIVEHADKYLPMGQVDVVLAMVELVKYVDVLLVSVYAVDGSNLMIKIKGTHQFSLLTCKSLQASTSVSMYVQNVFHA